MLTAQTPLPYPEILEFSESLLLVVVVNSKRHGLVPWSLQTATAQIS